MTAVSGTDLSAHTFPLPTEGDSGSKLKYLARCKQTKWVGLKWDPKYPCRDAVTQMSQEQRWEERDGEGPHSQADFKDEGRTSHPKPWTIRQINCIFALNTETFGSTPTKSLAKTDRIRCLGQRFSSHAAFSPAARALSPHSQSGLPGPPGLTPARAGPSRGRGVSRARLLRDSSCRHGQLTALPRQPRASQRIPAGPHLSALPCVPAGRGPPMADSRWSQLPGGGPAPGRFSARLRWGGIAPVWVTLWLRRGGPVLVRVSARLHGGGPGPESVTLRLWRGGPLPGSVTLRLW